MSKHERVHRPVEEQALGRVEKSLKERPSLLDQGVDLVKPEQILAEIKSRYAQFVTNNRTKDTFYTSGYLSEQQQRTLTAQIARSLQIYNVYFIPLTESGEKITLISIHRN